ncbi:TolC family protein [Acinetobacter sp. 194]|nr:TolC family protein [Acinetobacter shaoyimingii]
MNNRGIVYLVFLGMCSTGSFAEDKNKINFHEVKQNVQRLFVPKSNDDYQKVQLSELSNFEYHSEQITQLPLISFTAEHQKQVFKTAAKITNMSINEAVQMAVKRHPTISQGVSSLSAQNANIDFAKSGYYLQLSAGLTTGDLTSRQYGRQLFEVSARQLLYDFGKTKTNVDLEKTRLLAYQANFLVGVDDIAAQVANSVVNVRRYEELIRIAKEQIKGIARILEIASLRANAGISSQADPIQAETYLQAAEANLIVQQTQLNLYQQKLSTLLGMDVKNIKFDVSESLIRSSDIYDDPQYNKIPHMMLAKVQSDLAHLEKKQTQLTAYPTLSVRGSVSQAINGQHPDTGKSNDTDANMMLEVSSNFYQGGAIAAKTRSASYAEQAAKARLDEIYLQTQDNIRFAQEQIENKQKQMNVLFIQQAATAKTKELYQEQYKLNTRTLVDLLNAEQSIHSAHQQIESIRYDIYTHIIDYISSAGKSRDVYQLNHLVIQGIEIQP